MKARITGGYGAVRTYKDPRTGFWFARFRYRGERQHFKLTAPTAAVACASWPRSPMRCRYGTT